MIARNDRTNNEFYVCPVYNYGIGTLEDLGTYLERLPTTAPRA